MASRSSSCWAHCACRAHYFRKAFCFRKEICSDQHRALPLSLACQSHSSVDLGWPASQPNVHSLLVRRLTLHNAPRRSPAATMSCLRAGRLALRSRARWPPWACRGHRSRLTEPEELSLQAQSMRLSAQIKSPFDLPLCRCQLALGAPLVD